jgi:hypothetical protein
MNEKPRYNDKLVKPQTAVWYLLILCFAVNTILYLFELPIAEKLTEFGIILTVAATLFRLVVVSELYRRLAIKRYQLMSYLLVFFILATILIEYFK